MLVLLSGKEKKKAGTTYHCHGIVLGDSDCHGLSSALSSSGVSDKRWILSSGTSNALVRGGTGTDGWVGGGCVDGTGRGGLGGRAQDGDGLGLRPGEADSGQGRRVLGSTDNGRSSRSWRGVVVGASVGVALSCSLNACSIAVHGCRWRSSCCGNCRGGRLESVDSLFGSGMVSPGNFVFPVGFVSVRTWDRGFRARNGNMNTSIEPLKHTSNTVLVRVFWIVVVTTVLDSPEPSVKVSVASET